MGQQQLLLVILVTIIVGIATVVALNTFGSSAEQANLDAVRQDVAQIGASSQAWFIRPTMLEGGGNSFTGINFNNLNFPADSVFNTGLSAANQNGTYVLSGVTATQFVVTATPATASGSVVTGTITRNNVAIATTAAAE